MKKKNAIIICEYSEQIEKDIQSSKFPEHLFYLVFEFSFNEFINTSDIPIAPQDWIIVDLNSLNKNPDGLVGKLSMYPLNKKCYISTDLPQLAYYTRNPQEQFVSWENLVRREFFTK